MVILQLSSWIKERPLVAYFVLAFLITWVLTVPLVLSAQDILRLEIEHWHFLGACGPLGAALIVTAISAGRPGVSDFLASLWRRHVSIVWILVSILSPFVLFLLSVLILRISGGSWPDFGRLASDEYAAFTWISASLLSAVAYGIGEEVGWRGFALPRLQRGRSALRATFILSVLWALWHTPMFFYRFEFGVGQAIGFFIGLFAGAIWLTFLYNSTNGSTLMAILWHTTWNIVNIVGLAVSADVVSLMSAMIILAAIIIVILGTPARLSTHGKQTIQSVSVRHKSA